jgi:hypothetical protein
MPKIEKLFEKASHKFLLDILMNFQKIEVDDKFFYDSMIEAIDRKLDRIVQPKELVQLGLAIGMNPHFMQDHHDFIKKFYAHCFTNRFILA